MTSRDGRDDADWTGRPPAGPRSDLDALPLDPSTPGSLAQEHPGHPAPDSPHVDGNILAGPLGELFQRDLTTASALCSGCGSLAALAEAMVYPDPMGLVVRCASCDAVLLAIVESGEETCVDLSGITRLRIPRQQPVSSP